MEKSEAASMPRFDQLLIPTLTALRELGGSASIDELTWKLIGGLELPEEIVQVPHGRGSRSELEYRSAWARTYLKKYGLIDNSERGVWAFTSDGAKAETIDPSDVVSYVRELTRQEKEKTESVTFENDVDDAIEKSSEELASWRDVLLETLLAMSPDAFERLCRRLLRESGFTEVEVTGGSGDGGIDGQGLIRIGGLISFPVVFQCKRYSGNVGPDVVRDFRGAMMGRAEKGLLITTSEFTRDAQKEATRDGAPPIDLINGNLLMTKLKELGLGIQTMMVESVEIDKSWFEDI